MGSTRKTVSFSVSEETKNRLAILFPTAIGSEENLLKMIDAYEKSMETIKISDSVVLEVENQKLKEQNNDLLVDLEYFKENCETFQKQISELTESINSISESDEILTNLRLIFEVDNNESLSLKLKEFFNGNEFGKETEVSENQIILAPNPFVYALLKRTAEILTVKFGHEINAVDILIDMFIRYSIERQAEWFYPFVEKNEILKIAQSFNENIKEWSQVKMLIKGGESE